MIKVSTFLARNELGYSAVPLFGPADSEFEKVAAPSLLPPILQYIKGLRPQNDSQYVLVNALAAGEYFGSNINGDHFPEAALIHAPKGWTGNPLVDKALAKNWPYGFPTFYNAHPFAHHRNKDPKRAYGEVELALWNDHMKRVELVVRVDHAKCKEFGGIPVWDKLRVGQFPDVSMGSKVPYDTSSITLDWKLYREALDTFDPKRHRHPGIAVLEFHKKLKAKNGKGIPGVSVTRDDYDKYCKEQMNQILPDGMKVWVYNDFPRFFDISFVFIGADRTAKVMVYIVRNGSSFSIPSTKVAEDLGYMDDEDGVYMSKAASAEDRFLEALKTGAERKKAEINKQVVPSQMAGKAVPVMNQNEKDLPDDIINALGSRTPEEALSTSGGLGIVLRPREFQRITIIQMGSKPLADALNKDGIVFPKVDEVDESTKLDTDKFLPSLAKMLEPLMEGRSLLGPSVERRAVMISCSPKSGEESKKEASSHSSELLRKIGAAYNGYRAQLMGFVANTQDLMDRVTQSEGDLSKLASAEPEQVLTPLSYLYLRDAFLNELVVPKGEEAVVKHS